LLAWASTVQSDRLGSCFRRCSKAKGTSRDAFGACGSHLPAWGAPQNLTACAQRASANGRTVMKMSIFPVSWTELREGAHQLRGSLGLCEAGPRRGARGCWRAGVGTGTVRGARGTPGNGAVGSVSLLSQA